jgi:hypothetical protein
VTIARRPEKCQKNQERKFIIFRTLIQDFKPITILNPTTMKHYSDNTLSELSSMMAEIAQTIHNYSHVSQVMPDKIKKALTKFHDKVCTEQGRREDE